MAQTASKSLTVDNLVAWQRISGQSISDNGKWVACKMEPWEGDAVVNLYDKPLDSFFSALSPYYNPVQYIAPARPNSTPAHWDGSPPIATYPFV